MQCPDALSAEGEEGVADGENAFAAVPNRLRDEAMLKATGFHILPREADKVRPRRPAHTAAAEEEDCIVGVAASSV